MNNVETRRQILVTRKESGVAVLLLDCAGKLNYIGSTTTAELQQALSAIEKDPSIKAVVVVSGKPDNFIIGADVYEIRKATSEAEAHKLTKNGQAAINAIAACSKPFVAAVNGPAFGGGLEFCLAAHWRIASDHKSTQFGLPETRLGLIPGLGGTQRLPRLIGLKSALGMILSAEPVSAAEALSMGLIDEVVPQDKLLEIAEQRALELVGDPRRIEGRRETWSRGDDTISGGSAYPLKDLDEEKATKLFAMTERSIRIKTRGNYPAQTRVLEVMKTGLRDGIKAGLELEAKVFGELVVSEVSANLIALFFATDFAKQSALSLASKFNEDNTKNIGIVGSGTMGASIAALAAARGLDVTVLVKPGKEAAVSAQLPDSVRCSSDYSTLADCQIVIEAVAEDLAIKNEVLPKIEAAVSPECTIATNTSSLPLDELAAALNKNDRFVGLHFFHPVDKMPLVEIVALKSTARKSVARAADIVSLFDKIPAMVKNGPGFLINRLITVYILQAGYMLHEGIPPNWMDEVAVQFGMPIGPWELIDEVGIDVSFTTAESLYRAFGERMKPPGVMHEFWSMGASGKKVGRGVWLWEDGKRKGINPELQKIPYIVLSGDKCPEALRQKLIERMIYPMIDEAARCLEDKIVMKPREVDMAVIHGMGFPPFRGGLLKYADSVGLKEIAAKLEEIYGQSGETVSALIQKYNAEGRNFYSRTGGKEDE